MKLFLAFCSITFADVKLIEPAIAIEGYSGNRLLNADKDTATAACDILGKTYVAMKTREYHVEVVSFDDIGAMDVRYSSQGSRIFVLVCK